MAVQELAGSPRFSINAFDYINNGAVREYICNWSEVPSLVERLLRSQTKTPDNVILLPQHITVTPYASGNTVCPPTGVDSEGYPVYSQAHVTVTYGGYASYVSGSYLAGYSESFNTGSISVPISTVGLVYANTNIEAYPENPTFIARMPILEYRVSVRFYGTVPNAAIDLLGAVNSVPFYTRGAGRVFAPGKVMYVDLSYVHSHLPAVTPTVYTCTFLIHPYGWNAVYSRVLESWTTLKDRNGRTLMPYPLADLNAVLG